VEGGKERRGGGAERARKSYRERERERERENDTSVFFVEAG